MASGWENIPDLDTEIVASTTFKINNETILSTSQGAGTQTDFLETNEESDDKGSLWEIIYTACVLLFMFVALISDKVGADMVMMIALTLLMASKIISIQEGLAGFANEGLLTVLVLFVVASGISHTGALDWYMGKLLGRPNSAASAQLRLMIPIAIVSAFLNNTPVVAVMIPIVQRWGKNVGVSPQQLLIPLSFASILGGTCTLIGTSTNLVVVGLLQARYPGDEVANVGLFDLGKYGVPIAMAGMAYVLLFSMFLIPGSSKFIGGSNEESEALIDLDDNILLGARLTKWSAAVNRTVKRSGLRDTDGVYLVSVHRAATGNVHRAVGQEFVLNVGDILYFTGLVEGFGQFCEENGLEVITNEIEDSVISDQDGKQLSVHNGILNNKDSKPSALEIEDADNAEEEPSDVPFQSLLMDKTIALNPVGMGGMGRLSMIPEVDVEIGVTKESLAMSEAIERRRYINRIQDVIRGMSVSDSNGIVSKHNKLVQDPNAPPKIVAHADTDEKISRFVVVAISTPDRPGLLLDVSKTLIRLGLNFHKTEAMVVDGRSLSLWRCEVLEDGVSDIEEIWSVLNAMLEVDSGVEAIKSRGLRVVRAIIPKTSKLIGTSASETNFRKKYKAAIVAVQRDGKSVANKLSQACFAVSDVLVLQASDDSPLLLRPPNDFYRKLAKGKRSGKKKHSSFGSLSGLKKKLNSFGSLSDLGSMKSSDRSDDDSAKNSSIHPNEVGESFGEKSANGIPQSEEKFEFYLDSDAEDMSVGETSQKSEYNEDEDRANQKYVEEAWRDLSVVFTRRDDENDIEGQDRSAAATRDFLTAMEILPRSSLATKAVGALGLDKLPGVFLVSIERPSKDEAKQVTLSVKLGPDHSVHSLDESELATKPAMLPITQDQPLEAGDVLWFSGSAAAIGDLRKVPGMKSYVNEEVKKINEKVHDRRLVQAVIARRSKLVGKSVKETRFRSRFGAAVIAVHREGKRVQEHPGSIKLQAGDVLLLEAGPSFLKQNAENDNSFALLSEVEDSTPPRLKLLVPALLLAAAMLAVYTAGVASLLVSSLVASILMVVLGILTQQEVRDAINWEVYITIAAAFGIGTALTNSGVAGGVADGLVQLGQALGIGDAGLYGTVYFATFLISNVVTNNAAAALLFPIAMDAAEETGADRQLMSYTLMLGASASFMSPFGYTTNLLIYGPGGYKYNDFLRIGTPMQVVLWILSIIFISADPSKWYLSWIISALVLCAVSTMLILNTNLRALWSKYVLRKSQEHKTS